jgi:hypothetical protein
MNVCVLTAVTVVMLLRDLGPCEITFRIVRLYIRCSCHS